jgi:SNF2 family DNA or RNA helicase
LGWVRVLTCIADGNICPNTLILTPTLTLPQDLQNQLGGPIRTSVFTEKGKPDASGKMLTLQQLLRIFTDQGDKTLVFSQWTRMLDIIEDFVKARGWEYRRLDGSTPLPNRQKYVDEFNNTPAVQLFLISSKAGGLGLNLKSASKVIIFDMNWNPTVDQQAQDRAYRYGQTEHVSVYRLVTKGTVEEVVYMRQLYKQTLQTAVLARKEEEEEEDTRGEGGSGLLGTERRGSTSIKSPKENSNRR